MSVHWKPMLEGNCTHCGRILMNKGCVCPESSSRGKRVQPAQGRRDTRGDDFWAHDHFGLRLGFEGA